MSRLRIIGEIVISIMVILGVTIAPLALLVLSATLVICSITGCA